MSAAPSRAAIACTAATEPGSVTTALPRGATSGWRAWPVWALLAALAGTRATNEVLALVLLGSLAVAALALALPPNPGVQPLGPAEAGSSVA